jgi:hypothetical protein
VPANSESRPPITDPQAAQQADLTFRTLRARLVVGATQWLFVAGVLALATSLPKALDGLVAVAGVGYAVGMIRYFEARHHRAMSEFADPATRDLRIPGDRLPVTERERTRSALVVGCEIVLLVFVLLRR